MQDCETKQIPTAEIKSQIRQLLHVRQTKQALALCDEFGDAFLSLSAQLAAAQQYAVKGLVHITHLEKTKSRIHYALEDLLEGGSQKHELGRQWNSYTFKFG